MDIAGQRKGAIEPQPQAERRLVLAVFVGEAGVAGEMGKTGLLSVGGALLGRIAMRGSHLRAMIVEHVAHDGLLAAEHPLVGVDALDARSSFIASRETRLPQRRQRLRSSRLECGFVRLDMFISAPSLIARPNRSRIAMRSRS